MWPTNLNALGDNYITENSHMQPGLIRRFHETKMGSLPEVLILGTGKPKCEFLNLDAAGAHVMNLSYAPYAQHTLPIKVQINVACGRDVSIKQAARLVGEVVGYSGQMNFDGSRHYGALQKLMDSTKLNSLGLHAKVGLKKGLQATYHDL